MQERALRNGISLHATDWYNESLSFQNKISVFYSHSFFNDKVRIALKAGLNPLTLNNEEDFYYSSARFGIDTITVERIEGTYTHNWFSLSLPMDFHIYRGFFFRAEPDYFWGEEKYQSSNSEKRWYVRDSSSFDLHYWGGYQVFSGREVRREKTENMDRTEPYRDVLLRYGLGYRKDRFKVLFESILGFEMKYCLGITIEYDFPLRIRRK